MSLTMHIYSKRNEISDGYDVSEIVHDIEYTTSILGHAGKLTFILEKDPNQILQFGVGSLVKFWHSDNDNGSEKPIFQGNIFTIGVDKTEAYRVVAYDQTRYLQNHENLLIENGEKDLQYYFNMICEQNNLKKRRIVNWDKYILTSKKISGNNFIDVSAFEILQYCMDDFSIGNQLNFVTKNFNLISGEINGKKIKQNHFIPKFYLRDNFGTLELREIFTDLIYENDGTEKNNFLIIGDESLLTNYEYEVDIDKNTFNEFYFMYNEKTKETDEFTNKQVQKKSMILALQAGNVISGTNTTLDKTVIGENTLPKWGKLRKIVTLNDSKLSQNARFYIKELVQLLNQPTRTLKLSALGYDGLYAGGSFIFQLNKLKINYPVYVISATHRYNADSHTMELEINSNPSMEVFSK